MSPMSMTIFTSCGPRVSSCWRSLAPISTSSVRATSVSGELRSSSSGVGFGTAAAMTTSAQVSRAMSTGTLRVRPPSPRIRPSIVTGANTPGTAMLARIARARSPLDEHHHLAALHVGRDGPERDRQLVEVRDVAAARDEVLDGEVDVLGAEEPARRGDPRRRARRTRGRWSTCCRRACGASGPCSRSPRRAIASCHEMALTASSTSRAVRPEAKVPPTSAPMLVPTTQSIGMCSSSSAASTPTWAAPLAPPPPSTSPMRGRSCRCRGRANPGGLRRPGIGCGDSSGCKQYRGGQRPGARGPDQHRRGMAGPHAADAIGTASTRHRSDAARGVAMIAGRRAVPSPLQHRQRDPARVLERVIRRQILP